MSDDDAPIFCNRCCRQLTPGAGDFYVVNIEAVADPTPPVIDETSARSDSRQEISRLIEEMRHLSQQELMDQVYRQVTIHLCLTCFKGWIENPTE